MDVLKNKTFGEYNYNSRYGTVPYYYHKKDGKYFFGLGSNLYKSTSYFLHDLEESDSLDSLALTYYNNPTLYWVIALFNDMEDCFDDLYPERKQIKIPQIISIAFGDER